VATSPEEVKGCGSPRTARTKRKKNKIYIASSLEFLLAFNPSVESMLRDKIEDTTLLTTSVGDQPG